jgi:hypothetical protein
VLGGMRWLVDVTMTAYGWSVQGSDCFSGPERGVTLISANLQERPQILRPSGARELGQLGTHVS